MNRIIEYIIQMLPYIGFILPFILIYRFVKIKIKKKIEFNLNHEIVLIVFILFSFGLASITVIPKIEFTSNGISFINEGESAINLIAFKVISETYFEVFKNNNFNYFLINFLGNIIMFMSFGFFIPLLWNNISLKRITIIALLITLFIEISQIPQPRGTDIDDVWLNVLGVVLGYLVYKLINKEFTEKFKI